MHDWKEGSTVLTAKLATCKRCETLRVTEAGIAPYYIRRCASVRDERVVLEEPPCVAPARRGSILAWS